MSTIQTKDNAYAANLEIDIQACMYAQKAIRSLCSEEAQINVSYVLITHPDGKNMSQTSFEELIYRADKLFMARGSMRLPKELCILQKSMQSINMCLAVEEPITTVQYPYQTPPPAQPRGMSQGNKDRGQKTLPYKPGGSPKFSKKPIFSAEQCQAAITRILSKSRVSRGFKHKRGYFFHGSSY